MPSAFDAEFLADAAADFDMEFGETVTIQPRSGSGPSYQVVGVFESPQGIRNTDSPLQVDSERLDFVVLVSNLQHDVEVSDAIRRTHGSKTITYRVVASPNGPENQADDGGEIYRRISLQRVKV